MKKFTVITNILLASLFPMIGWAQTAEQKTNQAVKCMAKIDRYGDVSAKMGEVGKAELKIMSSSLTMKSAVIETTTFPLSDGYEITVSGFLIRPGGRWNEVSSAMSVKLTFSKVENGKRKYLAQDTVSSDQVRNKVELDAVQNGALKVSSYLVEIDYVNEVASGVKPKNDRVVGVQATCELVTL